jgi:hypothetical protein
MKLVSQPNSNRGKLRTVCSVYSTDNTTEYIMRNTDRNRAEEKSSIYCIYGAEILWKFMLNAEFVDFLE